MTSRPSLPAPWIQALALVALCLLCYLPGLFSTPPIDRDEARFAQASRQMLESAILPESLQDSALHAGGFAVPLVQDKPRLNKPPLIYWAQSASAFIFSRGDALRDSIWMYRVPSVLGAIGAVLATWWMGRRMFDERAALLAGALLATCIAVVFDAHQARSDQLLLGVTAWAMALLWNIIRQAHRNKPTGWWRWLMFWIVVGLGVLTKGLTPMVVLLTLIGFCIVQGKWWAWRAAKPMLGFIVIVAVVTPWVLAVADHVGFDNYTRILHDEVINRGTSAKEGHSGPPGYYFLTAAAMFWPAGALAIFGVWWGWRRSLSLGPKDARWKERTIRRPAELFLLCWLLPTWIFFEIYSTKLPHYTLPVYPALALLCARAAFSGSALIKRWPARLSVIGFAAVGVLVPSAILVGSVLTGDLLPSVWLVAPFAITVIVITVLASRALWKGFALKGVLTALVAVPPMAFLTHAIVLPRLTSFSPAIIERLDVLGLDDRPLAATGYTEDSLVFLTRGKINKLGQDEAMTWLREHPSGVLLLRQGMLTDNAAEFRVIDSVTGFQFARGKNITVDIVELKP
ncbi:MAG: glycosyltransferase family 39 protein [Phycisphaerales bacterium]|nr:glycosyltransferase family 39 protein [Phycisphaerales bacterium]MCB9836982.1 glycosyltransferase family 39 protein [Phycisphaera sp.]